MKGSVSAVCVILISIVLIGCGGMGVVSPCIDDVVICTCGNSGDVTTVTIRRCHDRHGRCEPCDGRPYTSDSVCLQFRYCVTCSSARYGGCLTCTTGVYGKTCLFEQTCGEPPKIANGFIRGSDLADGSRVAYFCEPGWVLDGDSVLLCQEGRWVGTTPTCLRSCGAPPQLLEGVQSGASNWTEGGVAVYHCDTHSVMTGRSDLVCRGGRWQGVAPVCVPTCGPPPELPHGRYRGSFWGEGGRVTYFCNDGYAVSGNSQLVCRDGIWTDTAPTCELTCGQPPDLLNGGYEGVDWSEGERVIYFCNDRWDLSRDSQLICRGGRWSGVRPYCKVGCGQPPSLHNGGYEGADWSEGGRVNYFCNDRWDLFGDSKLICLGGRWSGTRPSCEITCAKPVLANAKVHPASSRYDVNAQITMTCHTGFSSIGPSASVVITCLSTGGWSGEFIRCTKTKTTAASTSCSVSQHPVNGQVVLPVGQTSFVPGQKASFSCNKGFVLSSTTGVLCQADGSWSAESPRCIKLITCSDPGVPTNGNRVTGQPSSGSRRAGLFGRARIRGSGGRANSRIGGRARFTLPKFDLPDGQFQTFTSLQFSCDSALYELVGSARRTCQSTGEWTGQQPSCIPVCGKATALKSPTIINGQASRLGDWPWQAFVAFRQQDGSFFGACAGTLIGASWVVTAGHCVYNRSADTIKVFLGKYFRDNSKDDALVQKFQVAEIHVTPMYNPAMLDSDIALLRLSGSVVVTSRVYPICLSSLDSAGERETDDLIRPSSVITVAGWGQTENNTAAKVLRVAQVRTISNTACEKKYAQSGLPLLVTRNMFCAGQDDGRVDACYGDSGGPAMALSRTGTKRKWHLVGIVSWGSPIDCALPDQYGGYTRISRFFSFIKKHTGL